jgi:hypothetical protein
MKLHTVLLLIIAALNSYLTSASVSIKPDTNINLRGALQIPCETDDDCAVQVPCTNKWCPPVKVCINSKCRNPKIFEKCGSNVCNIQKGEGCCDAACGLCGKYSATPKKMLLCPKTACKPPIISLKSP